MRTTLALTLVLVPAVALANGEQANNRGIAKHRAGDLAGAIVEFTRAIRLGHPNKESRAWYYNNRGVAYLKQKQYAKAAEDFTVAVRLHRTDIRVRTLNICRNRAARQYSAAAFRHFVSKNYRQAEAEYSRAIGIEPKNHVWWQQRAGTRGKLKDWRGCISDARQALKLEPGAADAKKYLEEAQAKLRAATPAKPRLSNAERARQHAAKAQERLNKKEYRAAIREWTRAIELEPSGPRYNQRGVSKYRLKQYRNAIADFDQALRLNTAAPEERAWNYSNRASCKVQLGDYEGTIQDASQAIRLRQDHRDFDFRGLARLFLGRVSPAIKDFTRVLELAPNTWWKRYAYSHRGLARLLSGDKRAALTDFRLALKAAPNYYYLAHWIRKAGGGSAELERSTTQGSESWRLDARFALGRVSEAEYLRQAKTAPLPYPDRVGVAHGYVALAAERRGDRAAMARHFRECLRYGGKTSNSIWSMIQVYSRARLRQLSQAPKPATSNACAGCKASLSPGAKFCSNCGKKVGPPACAGCKQTLKPSDKFCSNCGKRQAGGGSPPGGE